MTNVRCTIGREESRPPMHMFMEKTNVPAPF
jgi:hypothetical protein